MFSASDVANFLACHHLLTLDLAKAAGQIEKPYFDDPGVELLRELGARHEQAYLRHLTVDQGLDVAIIPTDVSWAEGTAQTVDALRRGAGVIYQATFQNGPWHGRSDFLIRVTKHSQLGAWSYEPLETKLARSTKAGALVQLCFYADLLSQIQGVQPEWVHTVLGSGTQPEKYHLEQYIAYFRRVKRDFETAYRQAPDSYPEPVEHCNVCSWFTLCDKRRHDDDHLSLVPGTTRNQRKIFVANGVSTVAGLAALNLGPKPKLEGLGSAALVRIHNQARVQIEGRRQGHLVYELLGPKEPNTGLAALPEPSPGDVFLDLEGDPFAFQTGLEYLIGVLTVSEQPGAEPRYQALWSFDRTNEKQAFSTFIALVMERWRKHPGMHVYHYAPYEPTQIKRMAGQHGVCIDEVDQLLRARIFVDLYRVVRQGVRASVESYSIKKVEGLYEFKRAVPAGDSVLALETFAAALALGDPRDVPGNILNAIEVYNRDDCLSAWRLRKWLEDRRLELEAKTGAALPRPIFEEAKEEELSPQIQQVRALMERLTSGLPADETEWSSEQRARWLLAQMLEYHRREDKSAWWEYFRQCDLTDDELVEDRNALGGLKYIGQVGQVKRSFVHRYSFPPQDHSIDRAFQVHDPKTKSSAGTIDAIDDLNGTIDIKRGINSQVPHPTALVQQNVLGSQAQHDSLMRLAQWAAENGISGPGPFQAARDLLLRQPPRVSLADLENMYDQKGEITEVARQTLHSLCAQPSVLPLQGPPGTGKSYTGARMIAELVRRGHRVGITAVGHKVISNLLQYACSETRADNMQLSAVQKANDSDGCEDQMVQQVDQNEEVLDALRSETVRVVAGTPWLWARSDMANSVDVLFVDEAGQMSLADVLAISRASQSVVLLGDPQQLNQPQQGVHPPGVDVSALAHLLGGRATIEPDKGLFLKETWRLHPDICAFTSELFYDGRLTARPENQNQRLNANGPLGGSGLRYIPVPHNGNQSESPEEVAKVRELVNDLLASGATWVDKTGVRDTLKLADILVVAPYNAQVAALAKALPVGARIGTVDKFQGQQAPVVIYSMTTSTPEDAPRGMEFLYSLNRLNVAVSRAQCVAAIVASPALFQVECKTPRQIQLANALCRYLEMTRLE
ncbi:MAG TPA: TM0106 family RecB-like putative nuclease [Candidatus Acidoferrum sp.]|nr:TM0106 family RecB-like putative nuclease [Candidatus Acidoferrum sp.]